MGKRAVQNIRTEDQIWEVVSRERKKKRRVNEGITVEEWDRYFKDLLGGMSGRMIRGIGRREGKDQEGRLTREEIKEVFRRMKDKVRIDEVPAEVWKYEGEQ